ncbi:MAG: porphobilinogen synthase, partial [Chitinivibrionales bacterium]
MRKYRGGSMSFPQTRMRRLRSSAALRAMMQETRVCTHNLIMPLFVCPGEGVRQPVESMPGVCRFSVDTAIEECMRIRELGLAAVILFGISQQKDETGIIGAQKDGIVQRAVRAIKKHVDGLLVITDVCTCAYTSHGHCGVIADGTVDNDRTLGILADQAVSHAQAGSDMIAPSDMMDGRIKTIREALDADGFTNLPIMSYAVKYASSFYGPFRDAAGCAPQFGDR